MCWEAVLFVIFQLRACFVTLAQVQRSKMLSLVLIYAEIAILPEQGKEVMGFFWNGLIMPSAVKMHKIVINTWVSHYLTLRCFSFSLAS